MKLCRTLAVLVVFLGLLSSCGKSDGSQAGSGEQSLANFESNCASKGGSLISVDGVTVCKSTVQLVQPGVYSLGALNGIPLRKGDFVTVSGYANWTGYKYEGILYFTKSESFDNLMIKASSYTYVVATTGSSFKVKFDQSVNLTVDSGSYTLISASLFVNEFKVQRCENQNGETFNCQTL